LATSCYWQKTSAASSSTPACAGNAKQRLLSHAVAFRASAMRPPLELGPPDLATMDFLYQLGEIAAAGGDIRNRLFG
jgi:hypothetical protein